MLFTMEREVSCPEELLLVLDEVIDEIRRGDLSSSVNEWELKGEPEYFEEEEYDSRDYGQDD